MYTSVLFVGKFVRYCPSCPDSAELWFLFRSVSPSSTHSGHSTVWSFFAVNSRWCMRSLWMGGDWIPDFEGSRLNGAKNELATKRHPGWQCCYLSVPHGEAMLNRSFSPFSRRIEVSSQDQLRTEVGKLETRCCGTSGTRLNKQTNKQTYLLYQNCNRDV